MNRDILLVSNAREQSSRCKYKMIKPFSDTTLFDIHMNKLEKIKEKNNNIFDDIIVGISEHDETLLKKVNNYNIKIQYRNSHSVTDAKEMSEILDFLKLYNQKYVMWINASSPFISPDTILFFGDFFKKNNMKSLHVVRRRVNWFWKDGIPINVSKKTKTQTQQCYPIYESLHSFHIYNREYMLNNDAPWDFTPNNPYLYKLNEDSFEFFDVDTEEEFNLAEQMYIAIGRK